MHCVTNKTKCDRHFVIYPTTIRCFRRDVVMKVLYIEERNPPCPETDGLLVIYHLSPCIVLPCFEVKWRSKILLVLSNNEIVPVFCTIGDGVVS
jgi:hypothetical protein